MVLSHKSYYHEQFSKRPWGHFIFSMSKLCPLQRMFTDSVGIMLTAPQCNERHEQECKTYLRVRMALGCHVSTDHWNVFWHRMLERQNSDCSSVSEKCLFYRSTDENTLFTGLYECALSAIYLNIWFEFRVPIARVYKLQLMALWIN